MKTSHNIRQIFASLSVSDITYVASFIYLLAIYAAIPYVTAQWWANIITCIGIVVLVVDIIYLVRLRDRQKMPLRRCIMIAHVGFWLANLIYCVCGLIEAATGGYTRTDWVGNAISDTKYGFDAIIHTDYWYFTPLCLVILSLSVSAWYIAYQPDKNKLISKFIRLSILVVASGFIMMIMTNEGMIPIPQGNTPRNIYIGAIVGIPIGFGKNARERILGVLLTPGIHILMFDIVWRVARLYG